MVNMWNIFILFILNNSKKNWYILIFLIILANILKFLVTKDLINF